MSLNPEIIKAISKLDEKQLLALNSKIVEIVKTRRAESRANLLLDINIGDKCEVNFNIWGWTKGEVVGIHKGKVRVGNFEDKTISEINVAPDRACFRIIK